MCNPVTVSLCNWNDPAQQAALRTVRGEVFQREQGVPEELEWDDLDAVAVHVLARDTFGNAIGCGRLLPDGHIGRVAVLRHWRGKGVGTEIMQVLIALARERGHDELHLNAQTQAVPFYERIGFRAEGEEFLDAGIPHRHMHRRL
ncbi:MAG: GNAT family N-acetyltransferase [Thiohalomonadaceae bacterium]